MKLVKLLLNAVVAWALGIAFIATTLYFTNGGADFTTTDLMGFGVLAVVASGLMMLLLYLPGLYWLKRRRGGVRPRMSFVLLTGLFCNIPLFIALIIKAKIKWMEAANKAVEKFNETTTKKKKLPYPFIYRLDQIEAHIKY